MSVAAWRLGIFLEILGRAVGLGDTWSPVCCIAGPFASTEDHPTDHTPGRVTDQRT